MGMAHRQGGCSLATDRTTAQLSRFFLTSRDNKGELIVRTVPSVRLHGAGSGFLAEGHRRFRDTLRRLPVDRVIGSAHVASRRVCPDPWTDLAGSEGAADGGARVAGVRAARRISLCHRRA